MTKPFMVHDPVYSTVVLNELEQLLINDHCLQRLRKIQQLGLADTVYPGANHTRFEHSIGTMQTASIIGNSLNLCQEDIEKIRLAGLLHDVGHAAFSHAVENVLLRNPDLQPVLNNKKCSSHESFTRFLIQTQLINSDQICNLIEKMNGVDPVYFLKEIGNIAIGDTENVAKPYLSQIISSDIDADRIDFLLRDSYHTGISLGLIDVDQIVQSLTIKDNRLVLGAISESSYNEDLVITAAESMLIARSHHYTAIIHHPRTQAARSMLLYALEDAIYSYEKINGKNIATNKVKDFFTLYNDNDLLNFINKYGSGRSKELVSRIIRGNLYTPKVRFNQKRLPSSTKMSLSTIARHGIACKMFESEFIKLLDMENILIDLNVATGLPKTMRFLSGEFESFLYDESALANGLVRAISRNISLTCFVQNETDVSDLEDMSILETKMLDIVNKLSPKLLRFVREDQYLAIEGILLLFYSVHSTFEELHENKISIPRIRNITWLYRTIKEFSNNEVLKYLFDYKFHEKFGFPYSEKVYEHVQLLVAMGMVDEDLRYYEKHGRIKQRYEYVLTNEGVLYCRKLVDSYKRELEEILNFIKRTQHQIPRDMLSLPKSRYK